MGGTIAKEWGKDLNPIKYFFKIVRSNVIENSYEAASREMVNQINFQSCGKKRHQRNVTHAACLVIGGG